MTYYEDLKLELGQVESAQDVLFESIRPQADALAAQAKSIRESLELAAAEQLETYSLEYFSDPIKLLDISELLWNDSRGLELERELLRKLFEGTYIHTSVNFLESSWVLPRHLMSFTVAIPAKFDGEKLERTAQVLSPILKALHEVDPERALIDFLADEELSYDSRVAFAGGLFGYYDYGSAPRVQSSDLRFVLERIPTFG